MLVSLVIPVFNSSILLKKMISTTLNTIDKLPYEFELLMINDGSSDDSWSILQEIAQDEKRIKAVNLLKNYGQHNAVLCGMTYSNGDYIITMDDDLQNPPSEIIKLIDKISEGYDLVFGKFPQKKHANYRKLGTKLINYLNGKIFNKPKDITLTNFRIFNKAVCKAAIEYKTNYPYIPGLLLMNAQKISNTDTDHHPREVGKSNYSMIKIFKLMSNLLVNYSSYPLKILTIFGAIFSTISFTIGIVIFIKAIFAEGSIPGWASLMVMLSFMNGILIVMIGTLGVYISRTINQISQVQPYKISQEINFDLE